MAIPKFVSGANTLQFTRGPLFPLPKQLEKIQVTDRTAAGTLQVEDLGITLQRFTLEFAGMPQTDYDALVTWFNTIADGAANNFTYHDENGDTHTVKLITNPFDFQETYHGRFAGELQLEVVA